MPTYQTWLPLNMVGVGPLDLASSRLSALRPSALSRRIVEAATGAKVLSARPDSAFVAPVVSPFLPPEGDSL